MFHGCLPSHRLVLCLARTSITPSECHRIPAPGSRRIVLWYKVGLLLAEALQGAMTCPKRRYRPEVQYGRVPTVNGILISAVSSFWIAFLLGTSVVLAEPRSPSHRAFFCMSLSYALWSLLGGMVFSARSSAELWLWFRIAATAGILFVSSCPWFALALTRRTVPWYGYALVFGPSLPVHVRNWTSFFIFESAERVGTHWVFEPAWGSFWAWYWIANAYLMGGTFIFILVHWSRRTSLRRERRQARLLAIAMGVYLLSSGPFDYLVSPALHLPPMSPLYFLAFMVAAFVAIVRYRMLSITHTTASKDILESLDLAIVLTTMDARIVGYNRCAAELLAGGRPLAGLTTDDAFGPDEAIPSGFRALRSGLRSEFACFLNVDGKSGSTTLEVSAQVVRDRFGDAIGVLLTGHPIRDVDRFRVRYRITRREWQTIECLLAGASNRAAAVSLGVTVRTVKAHVSSIYQKLGVTNRMGLLGVLRRSGVLEDAPAAPPTTVPRVSSRLLRIPPGD